MCFNATSCLIFKYKDFYVGITVFMTVSSFCFKISFSRLLGIDQSKYGDSNSSLGGQNKLSKYKYWIGEMLSVYGYYISQKVYEGVGVETRGMRVKFMYKSYILKYQYTILTH